MSVDIAYRLYNAYSSMICHRQVTKRTDFQSFPHNLSVVLFLRIILSTNASKEEIL